MSNKALFRTGLVGSIVLALCCFTPVLVILFGAIGLASVVGYLDFVLLPGLLISLVILGAAIVRGLRKHG